MKHDWEYKKLGESCILTMGQSPSSDSYNSEGEGLPFFQGCSDFGLIHPTITTFCTAPTKIAQADDVLMSVRAPIGTLNIADVECCIGRGLASFRANNDGVSKFLYYVLKYSKDKLQSLGTGSTFKAIGKDSLRNFIIPVPPLPTQRAIVAELDTLNEILNKKRQQLKELDTLAQSIFYDMFGDPVENEKGWEVKDINDICSLIVRGPFGSALKKEFFVKPDNTTYKVYEQKHAINKSVDIGEYHISEEKFTDLKRFEVFPKDIIMSCSGTIGELFQIPDNAPRGIMNQALLKFTLNKLVCPSVFLFIMGVVKNNMVIHGCGLQNVGSVKEIKKIKFGLPPLFLQQSFARKIEAIEKQKNLINASIKEAQLHFDARMDYWFGE